MQFQSGRRLNQIWVFLFVLVVEVVERLFENVLNGWNLIRIFILLQLHLFSLILYLYAAQFVV